MINKDIDLTLASLFAGDDDPTVLYWHHRRYADQLDQYGAKNRILKNIQNHTIYIGECVFDSGAQYFSVLGEISEKRLEESFRTAQMRVLGIHSKHGEWIDLYEGVVMHDLQDENCECCGKLIHLLNKTRGYNMCSDCDDKYDDSEETIFLDSDSANAIKHTIL